MPLLFRSTNGQSPAVNLREALLAGQAPDRGLYFPERFPKLTPAEIAAFANLPYHEIAFRVLAKFTAGIIPDDALAAMCREAYNFSIPLEKIFDRVHLMRLDQGPTASFKDFAAQMMARMFGRFLREDNRQVTILTATSGDTGAAVGAYLDLVGWRLLDGFDISEPCALELPDVLLRAIRIAAKEDLAEALIELLRDRPTAEAMGARGKQVFGQQAGATARCVEALHNLLGQRDRTS